MRFQNPLLATTRSVVSIVVLAMLVIIVQGCSDPVSVDAEEDVVLSAVSNAEATAQRAPDEAAGEQNQTIVDIAVGNSDFSILVQALTEAGLVETLDGDGQYTVFAPTNSAFANLIQELDGVDSAADLLALPNLKAILLYHVAPGRRFARTVTRQKQINTVNGAFLSVDGTVLTDANDRTSNIVSVDIAASNGVVHVIDTVVLPPLN